MSCLGSGAARHPTASSDDDACFQAALPSPQEPCSHTHSLLSEAGMLPQGRSSVAHFAAFNTQVLNFGRDATEGMEPDWSRVGGAYTRDTMDVYLTSSRDGGRTWGARACQTIMRPTHRMIARARTQTQTPA